MLTGNVDWYHPDGYGVIRDAHGRDYFVHHTGLLPTAGGRLLKGQRVTFNTRERPRKPGTVEAYDVAPHTADNSGIKEHASQQPRGEAPRSEAATQSALEVAAAHALRVKRERRAAEKSGETARPADPFSRDARLTHPDFGSGRVILSTSTTITISFDDGEIRGFSRKDLLADLARPPAIATRATAFGAFMDKLRRETQAELQDEGIDTTGVYRVEEAREAESGAELIGLDARARNAFAREGITTFYSHQAQSYAALKAGRHVVLCTPTASGKTASFTPAILENLLQESGGTALYVFPLVALAADQTQKLLDLNSHLDLDEQLRIGVLNSSVDDEAKRETQKSNNDIVVTTPDMLHYQLLPSGTPNWISFFTNLRFLVLDEAHIYKGAFGSNVANIVRRVVARCMRLAGRTPQIVIASATVRDPLKLALQLTGSSRPEMFTVITKSGARAPRRHMLITREAAIDLCADLMTLQIHDERDNNMRPVRVIVFTRSVKGAQMGCTRLRKHLVKIGRSDLAERVADYYSAKSDKNDTFSNLRAGRIQCIYSTTALMAGIDIGSLDVVVVDGFPGLVMDARQMFGRAGRTSEGAAIFIAHRGDAFDEFYLENPDLLFAGVTEPVIANPENPLLMGAHLLCASRASGYEKAAEGPLDVRAIKLFGEAGPALIDSLEQSDAVQLRNALIHNRSGNPHGTWPLADLRATNDKEPVDVLTRDDRLLERMRRAQAYRDTHPDAVFVHDGEKYRVTRFPTRGETQAGSVRKIECERVQPDPGYWTQGIENFDVAIDKELQAPQDRGPYLVLLGDVRVQTSVAAYRRIHTREHMRCVNRRCRHQTPNTLLKRCPQCGGELRQRQVDEPESTPIAINGDYDLTTVLETQAAWIDLKPVLLQAYEERFGPLWPGKASDGRAEAHPSFPCAVNSAMSAVLKIFPDCANCDRDDVTAVSVQVNNAWRLYFYDHFPRGLGYASEFSRSVQPYFEAALDMVERCSCGDEGCPVCLHNYRGRQQGVLSKLGARYVLRLLLAMPVEPVLDALTESIRNS